MKLASITQRLNGLGSDKWAVHIEGKRSAEAIIRAWRIVKQQPEKLTQ